LSLAAYSCNRQAQEEEEEESKKRGKRRNWRRIVAAQ